MEGLRLPELVIILILIAVLFGPQKISGLGSGLGKAIRNFKDAMNGEEKGEGTGKGSTADPTPKSLTAGAPAEEKVEPRAAVPAGRERPTNGSSGPTA
jgi:sec-independent protein translocase protein TatA